MAEVKGNLSCTSFIFKTIIMLVSAKTFDDRFILLNALISICIKLFAGKLLGRNTSIGLNGPK